MTGVLSLMFNFYSENIFPEGLHGRTEGVKIGGEIIIINIIRYPNDTAIIAESMKVFQVLMTTKKDEVNMQRRIFRTFWIRR